MSLNRLDAHFRQRGCQFRRATSGVVLGLVVMTCSVVSANDQVTEAAESWQGLRGAPDSHSGVLPGDFALEVKWKQALGAGYSSPAIADGRVIVSFTAEDHDVVAALDIATGKELWRHVLAPAYRGHDGSEDGPLASPSVDGDRIYQLGPRGQLVALSLATGEKIWQAQLNSDNSTEPEYGYTSSPLVDAGQVIVMTGGETGAVTAYGRADGAQLWSAGNDSVNYQSPVVAELLGQRQIVATTNYWVYGVDPTTGSELWRHKVGDSMNESAHATPVSDSMVMVNLYGSSIGLEVSRVDGTWSVSEKWRSPIFGKTYALPVLHDGHLFGFTGRILTCADPATGDIVWRSRDLRALHLALVDGHLLALNVEGHVVLGQVSRAGYEEKAKIAVFERGDYAAPAFAGGYIVVRNQSMIAAVRVVETETKSQPGEEASPVSG